MNTLKNKLHPRRFPNMSGKMAALVGWLLGEDFTSPAIAELCVTSDGFVLARHTGDCGHNDIIGSEQDFQGNFTRLFAVAGLTPEELAWAKARLATIRHW